MKALKALLLIGLIFIINFSVFAQDSSLEEIGTQTINGKSWIEFKGNSGIKVMASSPIPPNSIQRLEKTISIIEGWTSIHAKEIWATFSDEGDSFIAYVDSVIYGNKDYVSNIPSGIRLKYQDELLYDFRISEKEFYVRVTGILKSDNDLAYDISQAVSDPAKYVQSNDPKWAVKRILELELALEESEEKLQNILEQEEKLQSVLEQKEKEQENELEIIKLNLASALNFFRIPIKKETVAFVKAQKEANPAISVDELLAEAKIQKVSGSKKEMQIILSVWYGE